MKLIFTLGAVIFFITVFFVSPGTLITGISKGLTLCATAVIPPLFPFMILSDFIIRSGMGTIMGVWLSPFTRFLFRLPGNAGCAVLMSMVGGYPVGLKMTAQLLESSTISEKQGRRMALFCVNAGPAFVIGTVGTVFYSDKKVGIILYISMILSSLVMGVFLRFFSSEEIIKNNNERSFSASVFGQSVMYSTQTMLSMCAWVLVFSGLISVVTDFPLDDNTLLWFRMVTEVTGGCWSAVGVFSPCVQALVMAWAGLSVHCQVSPFLKTLNVRYSLFALSRLIHAGLSVTVADVLFRIFPCNADVFSTQTEVLPEYFSVSVPAGVSMLILSAFVILEIPFSKSVTKQNEGVGRLLR